MRVASLVYLMSFAFLWVFIATFSIPTKTSHASLSQSSSASLFTPHYLTYRKVVLAFEFYGQPIPEGEVQNILEGAEAVISDIAEEFPDHSIDDEHFEYAHGNMSLLMVRAVQGEDMTWSELWRVLQALERFMTGGVGVQGDHYQALEFHIQTSLQENIGYGLVWYFPEKEDAKGHLPLSTSMGYESTLGTKNSSIHGSPGSIGVEKRTGLVNESWLQQPDTSVRPSLSPPTDDCIEVPDLGNQICIRSVGEPVPVIEINMLFDGIFAKIGSVQDPAALIPDNVFHYTKILNTHGSRTSITISGDHRSAISWMGLRKIFVALFMYIKGSRPFTPNQKQHYQTLQFDLLNFDNAKIAVGFLWYSPERTEKRGVSNGTFTSTGNTSILAPFVGSACPSVPNTDLELCFRNFGDPIPSSKVLELFTLALLGWRHTQDPITSFHFRTPYSTIEGGTSIDIQWRPALRLTYNKLYFVLLAVQAYMFGDESGPSHWQDLEFDIRAFGVKLGTGKVWHVGGTHSFQKT